jgi:hypothetical protein
MGHFFIERVFSLNDNNSVREIDRARQAEFRKQLELWDKMYSNRVQRLQVIQLSSYYI